MDLPEPCHTPLVWRDEPDGQVALPVDVEGAGPTGEWLRLPREFFTEWVLTAAKTGRDPQATLSWAINQVVRRARAERIGVDVAFRRLMNQAFSEGEEG